MSEENKRIKVVINPASGQDEPILNTINDVFRNYGIKWSISVTQKYGDATEFARQAAADGYDVVAGYGGDGTQHEIANGILGTDAVMGILPGGTGNNFAKELGTPETLAPAAELLCTSQNVRKVDVVQMGDECFILRLYVGIEPEEQTSREDKDKYGKLAYLVDTFRKAHISKEVDFRVTIDGEYIEVPAMILYVVNASKNGAGINVLGDLSSIDDGLMDAFILNLNDLNTIGGFTDRVLNLDTSNASEYMRQGKEMTIATEPDQPVWADGEYLGRTPISLKVLPGVLPIIVPE
jgi:YegS/Rv2252/BmrU family lipid kinase